MIIDDRDSIVAIDVETTGLDPLHGCKPFLIGTLTSGSGYIGYEVRVSKDREPQWSSSQLSEIDRFLRRYNTWVFFNAPFDLSMLGTVLPYRDVKAKIVDVQVMAHLYRNDWPHNLKSLGEIILGRKPTEKAEISRLVYKARRWGEKHGYQIAKFGHPNFGGRHPSSDFVAADYWLIKEMDPRSQLCLQYNQADLETTVGLLLFFNRWISDDKTGTLQRIYDYRMRLQWVLFRCFYYGMFPKRKHLGKIISELENEVLSLKHQIEKVMGPVNLNSPQQLKSGLQAVGVDVPSTRSSVLDALIQNYRRRYEDQRETKD